MDNSGESFFAGFISIVAVGVVFFIGGCMTSLSYKDDIKKEKAIYIEDVEYRCRKEVK